MAVGRRALKAPHDDDDDGSDASEEEEVEGYDDDDALVPPPPPPPPPPPKVTPTAAGARARTGFNRDALKSAINKTKEVDRAKHREAEDSAWDEFGESEPTLAPPPPDEQRPAASEAPALGGDGDATASAEQPKGPDATASAEQPKGPEAASPVSEQGGAVASSSEATGDSNDAGAPTAPLSQTSAIAISDARVE